MDKTPEKKGYTKEFGSGGRTSPVRSGRGFNSSPTTSIERAFNVIATLLGFGEGRRATTGLLEMQTTVTPKFSQSQPRTPLRSAGGVVSAYPVSPPPTHTTFSQWVGASAGDGEDTAASSSGLNDSLEEDFESSGSVRHVPAPLAAANRSDSFVSPASPSPHVSREQSIGFGLGPGGYSRRGVLQSAAASSSLAATPPRHPNSSSMMVVPSPAAAVPSSPFSGVLSTTPNRTTSSSASYNSFSPTRIEDFTFGEDADNPDYYLISARASERRPLSLFFSAPGRLQGDLIPQVSLEYRVPKEIFHQMLTRLNIFTHANLAPEDMAGYFYKMLRGRSTLFFSPRSSVPQLGNIGRSLGAAAEEVESDGDEIITRALVGNASRILEAVAAEPGVEVTTTTPVLGSASAPAAAHDDVSRRLEFLSPESADSSPESSPRSLSPEVTVAARNPDKAATMPTTPKFGVVATAPQPLTREQKMIKRNFGIPKSPAPADMIEVVGGFLAREKAFSDGGIQVSDVVQRTTSADVTANRIGQVKFKLRSRDGSFDVTLSAGGIIMEHEPQKAPEGATFAVRAAMAKPEDYNNTMARSFQQAMNGIYKFANELAGAASSRSPLTPAAAGVAADVSVSSWRSPALSTPASAASGASSRGSANTSGQRRTLQSPSDPARHEPQRRKHVPAVGGRGGAVTVVAPAALKPVVDSPLAPTTPAFTVVVPAAPKSGVWGSGKPKIVRSEPILFSEEDIAIMKGLVGRKIYVDSSSGERREVAHVTRPSTDSRNLELLFLGHHFTIEFVDGGVMITPEEVDDRAIFSRVMGEFIANQKAKSLPAVAASSASPAVNKPTAASSPAPVWATPPIAPAAASGSAVETPQHPPRDLDDIPTPGARNFVEGVIDRSIISAMVAVVDNKKDEQSPSAQDSVPVSAVVAPPALPRLEPRTLSAVVLTLPTQASAREEKSPQSENDPHGMSALYGDGDAVTTAKSVPVETVAFSSHAVGADNPPVLGLEPGVSDVVAHNQASAAAASGFGVPVDRVSAPSSNYDFVEMAESPEALPPSPSGAFSPSVSERLDAFLIHTIEGGIYETDIVKIRHPRGITDLNSLTTDLVITSADEIIDARNPGVDNISRYKVIMDALDILFYYQGNLEGEGIKRRFTEDLDFLAGEECRGEVLEFNSAREFAEYFFENHKTNMQRAGISSADSLIRFCAEFNERVKNKTSGAGLHIAPATDAAPRDFRVGVEHMVGNDLILDKIVECVRGGKKYEVSAVSSHGVAFSSRV